MTRAWPQLLKLATFVFLLSTTPLQAQEQIVDPDFAASVATPAYIGKGPTVAVDEAHSNFHTAAGRYRPFAELLRSDGYTVRTSTVVFEPGALSGVDVLVVANALPLHLADLIRPAFSETECDVVHDWVAGGARSF